MAAIYFALGQDFKLLLVDMHIFENVSSETHSVKYKEFD